MQFKLKRIILLTLYAFCRRYQLQHVAQEQNYGQTHAGMYENI
jgi:hypothetical protein